MQKISKNKDSNKLFDTIIIGGGPAGITAGIYLARRRLKVLIIYEILGGQTSITADIENYSGLKFISGKDFTEKLDEHLGSYDIKCKNEKVENVKKLNNKIEVTTFGGKYTSKTLIITTGARQRMLGIKGEKEFLNKGVAYCATCDAPLFRDKEVAIVGGGNSAMDAAIQLEKYAKKVFIIVKKDRINGEGVLIDKVKSLKKVRIIPNSDTKEIKGKEFVEEIFFEKNKKLENLKVNGVFIEVGYIPNSELFDVKKNNYGEIIVDIRNNTSVKGIFAAGDVTNIPVKQIIVAAGEGAKSALSCSEYLSRMK